MKPATEFARRRLIKRMQRMGQLVLIIGAAIALTAFLLPRWLDAQPGETALAAGDVVTTVEPIELDCRARATSRFYVQAFQDRDTLADFGEVPIVNKLPMVGDMTIQSHNAAGVLLGVVGDLETCVASNSQRVEVEDGVLRVHVYYIDFNRPRLDFGTIDDVDGVDSCVELVEDGQLSGLAQPAQLEQTDVVCADQEFMTGSTDSNRLVKLQQSLLQYAQALITDGYCLDDVKQVTEDSIRRSYENLADDLGLVLDLDLSMTELRHTPVEFPEIEDVSFAAGEALTCEVSDI